MNEYFSMEKKIEKKEGFKKTKIGWIPEDWWHGKIQDLVDQGIIEKPMDGNHGNIHPKSADFVSSGIPFVMANCIKNETLTFRNQNKVEETQLDPIGSAQALPFGG